MQRVYHIHTTGRTQLLGCYTQNLGRALPPRWQVGLQAALASFCFCLARPPYKFRHIFPCLQNNTLCMLYLNLAAVGFVSSPRKRAQGKLGCN